MKIGMDGGVSTTIRSSSSKLKKSKRDESISDKDSMHSEKANSKNVFKRRRGG
jgi:hypothetical protein